MTNLEKYKEAFVRGLQVEADSVEELVYQGIPAWDSVGHMSLVTEIEDAFDIIIELNSFSKGKEILSSNYGIEF